MHQNTGSTHEGNMAIDTTRAYLDSVYELNTPPNPMTLLRANGKALAQLPRHRRDYVCARRYILVVNGLVRIRQVIGNQILVPRDGPCSVASRSNPSAAKTQAALAYIDNRYSGPEEAERLA